jgi:alcohol dehydrogenase
MNATLSEKSFEIQPTTRTSFGAGVVSKLAKRARQLRKSRALIITDAGIVRAGLAARVAGLLGAEGIETTVFDAVSANPDVACVERGAGALRALADAVVIALGGGSSLDAAKAIALVGPNAGGPRDFTFGCRPERPGQPVIALPTTAGTGSETNMFGVITDPELGRKILIAHPSVQPVATFLDPELGLGAPREVTASCGMDVLTHAIEALTSNRRNPYSEALALRAIAISGAYLPRAFDAGSDLEARAQMLLASHLAGLAFSSSGLGICHAMGHPLSARFGAAHGQTLATARDALQPGLLRARLRRRRPGAGRRRSRSAAAAQRRKRDPGGRIAQRAGGHGAPGTRARRASRADPDLGRGCVRRCLDVRDAQAAAAGGRGADLRGGALKLHVERYGDRGPWLVLCHGFGGSARNFRAQARALSDQYRFVLYDARGHARSEAPPDASSYRPDAFVSDMRHVLDSCGAEHAVVGGLSMGAGIALRFALAHPERVTALVLASFPRSADVPGHREWALGLAEAIEQHGLEAAGEQYVWGESARLEPKAASLVRLGMREHAPHALAHTLRELLSVQPSILSLAPELSRLEMPALIVAGGDDSPSLAASEELAAALPAAELIVVPGGGHLVNLTNPGEVNRALAQLKSRIGPPQQAD